MKVGKQTYTIYYFLMKIIAFSLAIAMSIYILTMSSMNGVASGAASGNIIKDIFNAIIGLFDIEISEVQFQSVFSVVHSIARKVMHFSGFMILCICLMYSFEHVVHFKLLSIITAIIFAGMDEIYQTFIPARFGVYSDVLIDSSGALLAVLIVSLIDWVINRNNKPIVLHNINGWLLK